MPRAFVLLNADLGYEGLLVDQIKKLPGVNKVYTVYGVYDIMLKVEADSMENLKEFISSKIRRMNGIKSSLTVLIVDKTDLR
jgi:DNA-binding Lrp family transcriptional regulator